MIPIFNSLAPKIVKNSKVSPFSYLKKLEMHQNMLSEECITYFTRFLQQNQSIEFLKVSGITYLDEKHQK